MPILLNTPFNPGDNDPGKTYPRCMITGVEMDYNANSIILRIEFGDMVGGRWVSGFSARRILSFGRDEMPVAFDNFRDALHTRLVNRGFVSGTVE
jgi:hypothetical protein